ncbi:hypothetical protein [Spirosoma sordidisoli]|uniref:PorT family protein n=1 Tax=Spirosoma sordidisoli TaxID=2502893 RepID=A0A4Q2UH48_9BACT|nr:hypothetical protein [Spirosoma sordidisoli]RYC66620.1 hypothetical protein EQG79_28940 [Spirosoma sordidisoli]
MKLFLYSIALLTVGLTLAQGQSIRLGYYGETVTHYGLKVAYERPVWGHVNVRNQATKQFLIAPSLAAYRHPKNHIGFILSPELTYRRVGRRGGLFDLCVAPAYFRYFLDGTTYQAKADGDFERVRLAGGSAFMPTVSVGVGRDLSVKHHLPLSWYTRLNLMQQRPYNTGELKRFALEAGVILNQ